LDLLSQSTDANSSYTSFGSHETLQRIAQDGKEAYATRIRSTLTDMIHHLGIADDAVTAHPCAEDWSIIYVSPDGGNLTLTAHGQPALSFDEDEESSSSEDDSDEESSIPTGVTLDYHQLKATVQDLLEDFDVPRDSKAETEPELSNRASVMARVWATSSAAPTTRKSSHHTDQSPLVAVDQFPLSEGHDGDEGQLIKLAESEASDRHSPSVLLSMLEAAVEHGQSNLDLVASHKYWTALRQLRNLSQSSLARHGFAPLINYFARGSRTALEQSSYVIEQYDAWLVGLKHSQSRHDGKVETMMRQLRCLREKMWYMTDVKHSAEFEEARNVAVALRAMEKPSKSLNNSSISSFRTRALSKPFSSAALLKSEAQLVNLLTAPPGQGGVKKLSDDQSEMTRRWLVQDGVENLCRGEERIHRFCLEVERCVKKLVGVQILDGGAVLWSSELYQRDKRRFDSGRERGDGFRRGMKASTSIMEEGSTGRIFRGPVPTRFEAGHQSRSHELRSMSSRNASHHSFDSSNWSNAPESNWTTSGGYYLSLATQALNIDTQSTFWSPFPSQSTTSPSGSIHSHSPLSPSRYADDGLLGDHQDLDAAKDAFLRDVKESLIGLLLSDLGSLLWYRGSETDSWFSGELGDQCLELMAHQKLEQAVPLPQDPSMGTAGIARVEGHRDPLKVLDRADRATPAAATTTLENAFPAMSILDANSSIGDAHARPSSAACIPDAPASTFPFELGYRRLLKTFTRHSGLMEKLRVLQSLEQLICTSLRDGLQSSGRRRQDTLRASVPANGVSRLEIGRRVARARTVCDTIANCEYRCSHAPASSPPATVRRSAARGRSGRQPDSRQIVEVFKGLFRDVETRPVSLFRDLQYIAALVPFSELHGTGHGRAFWHASIAALQLKQEMCGIMIETADKIVEYHARNRTVPPNGPNSGNGAVAAHARFSMEDAARMWSITAKEGDPVAQRELAILYLTHPDLLRRTTLPLSRPRDTFRAQMMSQRDEDPMRSDPATMCVAYHWMELSAQGGDELARQYLKDREQMNALP
jgi:hypothetical protein